ncbi:MAG TPA: STAS domain-containing protein [Gammaproteobacteria bacterium]
MIEHRLPEQIDIRRIAELHRALAALIASADDDVALDAAGVARIDTAGVQLLAAAMRSAGSPRVVLTDPSPCVAEAFEALGLAHLLNS